MVAIPADLLVTDGTVQKEGLMVSNLKTKTTKTVSNEGIMNTQENMKPQNRRT